MALQRQEANKTPVINNDFIGKHMLSGSKMKYRDNFGYDHDCFEVGDLICWKSGESIEYSVQECGNSGYIIHDSYYTLADAHGKFVIKDKGESLEPVDPSEPEKTWWDKTADEFLAYNSEYSIEFTDGYGRVSDGVSEAKLSYDEICDEQPREAAEMLFRKLKNLATPADEDLKKKTPAIVFRFREDLEEVIRLEAGGNVYIRGNLVADDKEIYLNIKDCFEHRKINDNAEHYKKLRTIFQAFANADMSISGRLHIMRQFEDLITGKS